MNKIFSILFCGLMFASCCNQPKQITVTNPTDLDRTNEMVEVEVAELGLCGKACENFVLVDADGNEVSYQLMFYGQETPQSIIFQANVKAGEAAVYTLEKGMPSPVTPKVSARYVPERKDDYAWENEAAAYRMYGPALANENPSNGVDLWLKRTDELIVDTFYYNELELGQSYHIDHGKGLDCYKVADKLGCGGVAPFAFDTLWVGKHYDRYENIDQGALRCVFAFEYDHVKVGQQEVTERIVITVDAGAQLNKAVVTYNGADIEGMQVAAGIYLHDVVDNPQQDLAAGWIAYAENATSDAGVPSGRNYGAVVVPGAKAMNIASNTLLAYADYQMGSEFTYYFGGGWSKWMYPTDQDWFDATARTAKQLANPLQVTVQ